MMKKQKLINLFESVLAVTQQANTEVSTISTNIELSVEGKQVAIDRVRENAAPTLADFKAQALTAIEDVLKAKQSERQENTIGKLSDSGYQAGLANTVKLFEVGAVTIDTGKELIEYYREDRNALSLIKAILEKSPSSEDTLSLIDYLPKDTYSHTIKVLNDLYNGVNTKLDASTLIGEGTESYCVEGWLEFLNTRLDDAFNII